MAVTITYATEKDLSEIVALHKICFPNEFLTQLGTKLLISFYKEFITSADIFLVYIVNNSIKGFVLCSFTTNQKRYNFIKNNILLISVRMALLIFKFDQKTIKRIIHINDYISHKTKKQNKLVNVKKHALHTLLSICVSPDLQGSGISTILIQELESILFKNGVEGYRLSVKKDNKRACAFYEKIGMQVQNRKNETISYCKFLTAP